MRLFVWFAGHGYSATGEGFLVPADAPRPETGRADFKLSALSLRRFGELVRLADAKHVYAVFDACFAGTIFDSSRTLPSPAITRASVEPVRQFLSSGDADQAVSDDGMFRDLFLRALSGDEPADLNGDGYVTASELGLFLSDRVTNLTSGRQTPRYGKLRDRQFDRGDFVFARLAGPAEPAPRTGAQSASRALTPAPDRTALELEFWNSIKDSAEPADFDAYLRQFPNGTFAGLARNRLDAIGRRESAAAPPPAPAGEPAGHSEAEFWDAIKDSLEAGAFMTSLQRYPDGRHAAEASRRIDELLKLGDTASALSPPSGGAGQPGQGLTKSWVTDVRALAGAAMARAEAAQRGARDAQRRAQAAAAEARRLASPGYMRIQLGDGAWYEGGSRNGQPYGHGIFIWPQARYEGEVDVGISGYGVFVGVDGESYEGQSYQHKKHGFGVYRKQGSTFEGEYSQDAPGMGVVTAPGGAMSYGDYTNQILNGAGVVVVPNSFRYEGEFRNNQYHGRGIMFGADGTMMQAGRWENGVQVESFALTR